MAAKKSAEVLIGGHVYTLSGYEEEEYLQKVAAYINSKRAEVGDAGDNTLYMTADMRSTMIELNIADDYFKAKEQVSRQEEELERKDKEIYDLKHDLISDQVKVEALEESLNELEKEKKELLAIKAKLESSLEEALLGSINMKDET